MPLPVTQELEILQDFLKTELPPDYKSMKSVTNGNIYWLFITRLHTFIVQWSLERT